MMTVVNAESATSYMHQPKISFFVTGGADCCIHEVRNLPDTEQEVDHHLIQTLVGEALLRELLTIERH